VLRKVIELASPLEQYVWIQKIAEAARVKESVLSDELAVLKKSSLATATHSDPRATVQTVESDRSSYEPRTRREKLWVRLFVTALIEPGVVPALVDAETFLPERYSGVLARLSGKESAPEDGAFLDALDMRSSLVAQEGSVESMHAETAFLLQEVRREYIRERREELAMQIQEAERAHDEARVKALVAAFDEMAKVIDNESRG
jgi:hypothetical protein